MSPLPSTAWVPPDRSDAVQWLDPGTFTQTSWNPAGFRFDRLEPSSAVAFLTGGLMLQEEAAMAAVSAMAPQPGETILDLCAAPGNKTIQLASAVGANGWVVGNDVNASRMQILRGAIDRFGLANVSLTIHDGTSFPMKTNANGLPFLFDAVLADVPCSCEGTCRKHPAILSSHNSSRRDQLPAVQEKLLRRAIQLTRPRGRVLYATCTFNPHENEGVLSRVLNNPDIDNQVRISRIQLDGLVLSQGLISFEGEQFHPDCAQASRIWPHHNDTGGFFLALLTKQGDVPPSALNESATGESIHTDTFPWSAYGLEGAALHPFASLTTGRKYQRLITRSRQELGWNEWSAGMTGLNQKSRYSRFSTPLALKFGRQASAGVVEVDPVQVIDYLSGGEIQPVSVLLPAEKSGTVIARCQGTPLGLAERSKSTPGAIQSLFPRHWAGLEVKNWLARLGHVT